MFTAWNDRIEVTAPGAYVVGLLREDRRLGELLYPGKTCEDQRVVRIAVKVEAMADLLRGSLRDELALCGALPLGPDDSDQPEMTCDSCGNKTDNYRVVSGGSENDYDYITCRACADSDHPDTPTLADLCAMDDGGYPLDYEPSEAEKLRFYHEDDAVRNFCDYR